MPTSRTAYVAQRQAEPEETRDLGDNFWYDSDDEDDADIYGYDHNEEQEDNDIQFDDSENENDDDDDVSVDNDSVMDRKQPNKAEDESDDLEDGELKLEK